MTKTNRFPWKAHLVRGIAYVLLALVALVNYAVVGYWLAMYALADTITSVPSIVWLVLLCADFVLYLAVCGLLGIRERLMDGSVPGLYEGLSEFGDSIECGWDIGKRAALIVAGSVIVLIGLIGMLLLKDFFVLLSLQKAVDSAEKGELERAIIHFSAAERQVDDERKLAIRFMKAAELVKAKRYAEAQRELTNLIAQAKANTQDMAGLIAASYQGLGVAYLEEKQYKEAYSALEKSIEIIDRYKGALPQLRIRLLGPFWSSDFGEPPNAFGSIALQERVLLNEGNYKEAHDLLNAAMTRWKAIPEHRIQDILAVLKSYSDGLNASVSNDERQFLKDHFVAVQDEAAKKYGSGCRMMIAVKEHYANALQQIGESSQAIQELKSCLAQTEKSLAKSDIAVAMLLFNLARLTAESGDRNAAKDYLKDLLQRTDTYKDNPTFQRIRSQAVLLNKKL